MNRLTSSHFFDLSAYQHELLFKDCEYVWEALTSIPLFMEGTSLGVIEGNISQDAYLINPELISIGEGSVVEPGAYIKGPCVIGRDCTVRHGAYIRGGLITGNGCVIGHATEIKNSILLDDVHAAHFAYVGDSILGNRVNIGAGTRCANLRLDKQPVAIFDDSVRIETGLRKFGVIMGDDAQTGCNAVTNPGTLFGKGMVCYPCKSVGGVLFATPEAKGE